MKPLFRSPKDQQTHSRSGIAFIVEMLILLILVAGCLSVLIQAFAFAHQQGEENSATVKAVHLASSTAERFSADPNSIPEVEIISDAGAGSRPYYGLETARYVKAGEM